MVNMNHPNEPAAKTRGKAHRLGVALLIMVLAFIVLATLWGIGYFQLRTTGKLQMPDMGVEVGALPDADIDLDATASAPPPAAGDQPAATSPATTEGR